MNKLTLSCLLLTLIGVTSACSNGEQDLIVGKWNCAIVTELDGKRGDGSGELEFLSNGTFLQNFEVNYDLVNDGTFSIKANSVGTWQLAGLTLLTHVDEQTFQLSIDNKTRTETDKGDEIQEASKKGSIIHLDKDKLKLDFAEYKLDCSRV